MTPGEGNGSPLQYSGLGNPWTGEPGGLQSMGSWRGTHAWVTQHTSDQRSRMLTVEDLMSIGETQLAWMVSQGAFCAVGSLILYTALEIDMILGWGKLSFFQNTQHILLSEPALERKIKMSSSCVCQLWIQVPTPPWAPQTWKAWWCFSQQHSALGPLILGMAPWIAAAEPGGGGIHWGTQRWAAPPTPVGDQGSLGVLSSVDPEEGNFFAMVLFGINGHELEQTLGDRGGQGSLVWCGPWGCKEVEQLNNWTTPICNINTRC